MLMCARIANASGNHGDNTIILIITHMRIHRIGKRSVPDKNFRWYPE